MFNSMPSFFAFTTSTWFLVVAIIAIIGQSLLLVLALFEPGLDYKIDTHSEVPLDSEDFQRMLEALTDAQRDNQRCSPEIHPLS
jgi:hypothetical protein